MQLKVLCLVLFGCIDSVLSDYRNNQNVKAPVIIRKKTHHTIYKQIYPDKIPDEEEQPTEQISKDDIKRKHKVVKKPKSKQDPKPKRENRYEWIRESNKNEIVVTPEKTQTIETDDKGYQTLSKVITKEHVEVQEINPLAAFPSDRVVVKGSYKVHETDPNMQTTSTVHTYDSPSGKAIAEILTELDQIRHEPDDKKTLRAEESSYKPFQREKEFESLFDFDPFKDEKDTENGFEFDPFESRAKKIQFDDFFDETEEDESRDEPFKKPYTEYQQPMKMENHNKIEDNDYVESTNYEEEPSSKEEMITPFPKIHFDYSRGRRMDSYSDLSPTEEPSNREEMITPFPKVHFDYPRMDFHYPRLAERNSRFEQPQESDSRAYFDYPDEAESKTITITPKTENQYHYEYDFAGKGQASKKMAEKLMRAEDHHQPYDYAKREEQKAIKEDIKPQEEEDHSSEYDAETHDKTEETKEEVIEATTPKLEENPHVVHELANPAVTGGVKDDKMKMTKLKQEEYDDHFDFLKHDDEDCPYERLKGSETSSFENDALEKYVIYKIYGPLYNSEH